MQQRYVLLSVMHVDVRAMRSCRRSSRSVCFLGASTSGVTRISGGMVSECGGGVALAVPVVVMVVVVE